MTIAVELQYIIFFNVNNNKLKSFLPSFYSKSKWNFGFAEMYYYIWIYSRRWIYYSNIKQFHRLGQIDLVLITPSTVCTKMFCVHLCIVQCICIFMRVISLPIAVAKMFFVCHYPFLDSDLFQTIPQERTIGPLCKQSKTSKSPIFYIGIYYSPNSDESVCNSKSAFEIVCVAPWSRCGINQERYQHPTLSLL